MLIRVGRQRGIAPNRCSQTVVCEQMSKGDRMTITSRELTEAAQSVLRKMRRPASPLDRPGDWAAGGLSRDFGEDAIDQLVSLGLVQRGGTPSLVPDAIAAMYPNHMAEHRDLIARLEARGSALYPAADSLLFITQAGWLFPVAESNPNAREINGSVSIDAARRARQGAVGVFSRTLLISRQSGS